MGSRVERGNLVQRVIGGHRTRGRRRGPAGADAGLPMGGATGLPAVFRASRATLRRRKSFRGRGRLRR